jgi:hypothetical protein
MQSDLSLPEIEPQDPQAVQHVVQGLLSLAGRSVDQARPVNSGEIQQVIVPDQQIVPIAAVHIVMPRQHATGRMERRDDLPLGIPLGQRMRVRHHVGHDRHQRLQLDIVGSHQRSRAGDPQQFVGRIRQQLGQHVPQGELDKERLVQAQHLRVQRRGQAERRAVLLQHHVVHFRLDEPQAVQHVGQIGPDRRHDRDPIAEQGIVVRSAAQRIVASLAEHHVVAVVAVQHVVVRGHQLDQQQAGVPGTLSGCRCLATPPC